MLQIKIIYKYNKINKWLKRDYYCGLVLCILKLMLIILVNARSY